MKVPNKAIIQLLKFGIVGVANTLVTAGAIWFMLNKLESNNYIANVVGYALGLINSFVWNSKWTFETKKTAKQTFLKFVATFAISYLFQLANLYLLLNYTKIEPYICQLLSILVYTGINFLANKHYTFRN